MCSKTTCPTCKKATWSGCGNHIEQALAGVPTSDRCTCGDNNTPAGTSALRGIFSTLFG